MLMHSSKDKNKQLMAKVKFSNQADLCVTELYFSTLW